MHMNTPKQTSIRYHLTTILPSPLTLYYYNSYPTTRNQWSHCYPTEKQIFTNKNKNNHLVHSLLIAQLTRTNHTPRIPHQAGQVRRISRAPRRGSPAQQNAWIIARGLLNICITLLLLLLLLLLSQLIRTLSRRCFLASYAFRWVVETWYSWWW